MHAVGPGLDMLGASGSSEAEVSTSLTFEQRREILLSQMEIKRRLSLGNVGGVGQVSVGSPGSRC